MFAVFGNINIFKYAVRKDGFTYSYITYDTIDQAKEAIKYLHKKKFAEKTLKVSFAVSNCESKMALAHKIDQDKPLILSKKTQKINKKKTKQLSNAIERP